MRGDPRRGEAFRVTRTPNTTGKAGKDAAALPSASGAAVGRRIGIGLMYGLWKPRVLGAWRIPAGGPVILAGNHSHNLDGPMLIGTSPRPVHFLVKKEAFVGPLDPFLRGIGQLKVDRVNADRTAITDALGVLERGGVLGIFPEGTRGDGDFASLRAGLAYFAVRSGAPIVPVAVLGTTARRGRVVPGLPPLRSRIDVVFGDPFEAGDGSGRRTRSALDEATVRVQKRLGAHLADARRLTGRAGHP
ncbi:lysophospholipid acyltransferase family protein [Streptomyces sp. NPDC059679]|uniref:lysophospholipid acyltransferase family protein n=1 Tax=Streptomyces sp. NPDC059679 TaxID=3346903 RepID=UPI0036969EB3